jgi:hypothetical protein
MLPALPYFRVNWVLSGGRLPEPSVRGARLALQGWLVVGDDMLVSAAAGGGGHWA